LCAKEKRNSNTLRYYCLVGDEESCQEKGEAMPTVAQMLEGLRSREEKDKQMTEWLFVLMGSKLVGAEKWSKKHKTEKWSNFVPVSCEAFLFLVLENNEEAWKVNAINKTKAPSEKLEVPKLKYTQGNKRGGKNGGYNDDGKKRYAALMAIIKGNRAERNVGENSVEDYMLEGWKKGMSESAGGSNRSSNKEESEVVAKMIDVEAWEMTAV